MLAASTSRITNDEVFKRAKRKRKFITATPENEAVGLIIYYAIRCSATLRQSESVR